MAAKNWRGTWECFQLESFTETCHGFFLLQKTFFSLLSRANRTETGRGGGWSYPFLIFASLIFDRDKRVELFDEWETGKHNLKQSERINYHQRAPNLGALPLLHSIIFRIFKWTSSFSWKALSKAFNYLNFLENNLNTVNASSSQESRNFYNVNSTIRQKRNLALCIQAKSFD